MPTQIVVPTKVQKLEFSATTAEGACRVTVVTGEVQANVSVNGTGGWVTQSSTFKALVDPTMTPGQFRKATATASLSTAAVSANAVPVTGQWTIEDVQATLDDESGQVQLTFDLTAGIQGTNGSVYIGKVLFQVTTLSKA